MCQKSTMQILHVFFLDVPVLRHIEFRKQFEKFNRAIGHALTLRNM